MPDKSSASSFSSPKPNEPRLAGSDSLGGSVSRPVASRGSEARDAAAEMAERAQLIGQEAGTKITAAMRDVIGTAAGLAGFAVESVRDLVQYLVRRGQMTQDEADQLIREAEGARGKRASRSDSKSVKTEPRPAEATAQSRETPAVRGAAKSAKKTAPPKSSAAASEKSPTARKPAGKKMR
jgi:polyhydroxyalkanoate synthesis regulator phasin